MLLFKPLNKVKCFQRKNRKAKMLQKIWNIKRNYAKKLWPNNFAKINFQAKIEHGACGE